MKTQTSESRSISFASSGVIAFSSLTVTPFKTRRDRLGCSWAELGKRTADCSKTISRTECQQSAQAQPVHPFVTKTIIRLARSWAEVGICTADCPEQSTLPRTTSRPRRNRYNLLPLEKLTPRSVECTSTRSEMRNPERSG